MRRFSWRPTLTLRGRKFKGLRGWSGKPLHPPLTDVPIASYIMGAGFDLISMLGKSQAWSRNFFIAGGYLFVVGLCVSLLTALTGFSDWKRSTAKGTQVRRTANTHATAMILVTVLAIVDVILRLNAYESHDHPTTVILVISIMVAALVAVGATLGGTLVYDYGFNVETAQDSAEWHVSEIDLMPGRIEPVEKEMSPADLLADVEVAVTNRTIDPLTESSNMMKAIRIEDLDEDSVRSADEGVRSRIWSELVARLGPDEASRRWLAIFAATDAPRTG